MALTKVKGAVWDAEDNNVFINVFEYGAKGNGVTDDTTAIQAAIDAASSRSRSGKVFFPRGEYLISSALEINDSAITLEGENRLSSFINQSTASANCVNVTVNGTYANINNLSFDYVTDPPTVNATAIYLAAVKYVQIHNVFIQAGQIGIHFDGTTFSRVTESEIFWQENIGIYFNGTTNECSDCYVDNVFIQGGFNDHHATAGIRFFNKVEGCMISNTAVTNGVHGLTTDATVYAAGSRPFANKFTNVFFDSYQEDCILKNCAEFEFVNCQWAGGRSGVGFDGLEIVQSNGNRFTNCTFVNCGRHGCNVNEATAINTSFLGCVFDSNSVTSGASVAHGLRFTTSVQKFQVQGCLSGNNYGTGGTQGLGIQINGSCDNFDVSGNNLIGNGTSGLADASSATATKTITRNLGHRTENQGTGEIANATTSDVIAHGLDITPSLGNIHIIGGENPTNDVGTVWIDTIGSANFTVNCENDPGASGWDFGWSIR